MPEVPCRYSRCPAFKSERSPFGYCTIHNQVATVKDIYDKALAGRVSAELKLFAQDLDRGIFPSFFR
jgi:hypothetical protein